MAIGIPTGFVRKLYRILDHESTAIIRWDDGGSSFSIFDSDALDTHILPRYYRGRLSAFRQQLVDHGFTRIDCETREVYRHPDFLKGQPGRLSKIERKPKRNVKSTRKIKTNPDMSVRNEVTTVSNDVSTPVETRKPQQSKISLKVTLTVPPIEGRKRSRQDEETAKPLTTRNSNFVVQTPPKKSKNPLFSDDPEQSLAKFAAGIGLLPASSELPDPISYLNKRDETATTGLNIRNRETSRTMAAETETSGNMYSDDLVKSALLFLASSSCTGVESKSTEVTTPAAAETLVSSSNSKTTSVLALPTVMTTSTSTVLASLLASSSTGSTVDVSFASGENPLFSDKTMDGDDDSIWNILVSSSVDRVRSAIDKVESPKERLRLILEERQKLEEERKKVGAPAEAILPKHLIGNNWPKQQNPSEPSSGLVVQREPVEDDLWKLLMSSSIDSFRRVMDVDM